ncbi:MAG: acyl-CoA thioesterase [Hydrocarboniphaga sp.]|uniref:acyl-CoA thioesterase n=1 Tax=Hydrocarboniphaga sp. TaxID=2033016 RepID=UPI002623A561|nr:thioesterase family protein [Hydrocarboniphaga sp.]MDB5969043.1 acyl-CoA thioesterase [Hydrocarboniphaga sp.]
MTPPFRYYLRVRYGECDAQKVVFNARYGDYVDLASSEFINALGYASQTVSGAMDWQLVRQTIEWEAPARFGDVLEISVSTARLGTTSFTLGFDFRVVGREEVTARCETVYVLVNSSSLSKRELPAKFRERLQLGAPGVICDHAGLFTAVAVNQDRV